MRCAVSATMFCAVLLMPTVEAGAQAPAPPAAQLEAMRALDAWVGEWEGAGWRWTEQGRRRDFRVVESVRAVVGGSVLIVEGTAMAAGADGGDVVVHEALGVLSYDEEAGRYRFRAHDLKGQPVDADFRRTDRGAQWGFRVEEQNVELRFTIELDADRWHEHGEVSVDGGATWHPLMEMTLRRRGV